MYERGQIAGRGLGQVVQLSSTGSKSTFFSGSRKRVSSNRFGPDMAHAQPRPLRAAALSDIAHDENFEYVG